MSAARDPAVPSSGPGSDSPNDVSHDSAQPVPRSDLHAGHGIAEMGQELGQAKSLTLSGLQGLSQSPCTDGGRNGRQDDVATPRSPGAEALVRPWRVHAELLRQYRNQQQAEWLEDRAAELERALQEHDNELLTLTAAGEASGYSADHLGRLVRQGALENLGRPNAPKVRRGDLPRKPTLSGGPADPRLLGASRRQVAKAITTSGSRR